jgi:hypothetical protein
MLIPGLHDLVSVSHDDFAYGVQFFCRETLIFCQRHGPKPEFANHFFPLIMYVHPLVTVKN